MALPTWQVLVDVLDTIVHALLMALSCQHFLELVCNVLVAIVAGNGLGE